MFLVLSSVPFASTSACDYACSMHLFLASFDKVETTTVLMLFFIILIGGGGAGSEENGAYMLYRTLWQNLNHQRVSVREGGGGVAI